MKYFWVIQSAMFIIFVSSACIADVIEYTDEATFIASTGPQQVIDFETYGDGTSTVGEPSITGDEWLNLGIQFAAIEAGDYLYLSEKENMPVSLTHTLIPWQAYEDRCSTLITFITPVLSFGVYIVDNETTSSTERIILRDKDSNLLGDYAMPGGLGAAPPLPIAHDFIGFESAIGIAEVWIIEDHDGEGMLLDNVMYSVPEPTTMALLSLSGLAMLLRKRK